MIQERHAETVEYLSERLGRLKAEEGFDYIVTVRSSTNDKFNLVNNDPSNGLMPPVEHDLDEITIKLFKEGTATTLKTTHINDTQAFEELLEDAKAWMLPSREPLPQKQEYPKLNLFDQETADLSRQDMVDISTRIREIILEGRRILQPIAVYVEKSVARTTVFSSTGIKESFDATYFQANTELERLEIDEQFFKTRRYGEFNLETYARRVRDTAIGKLNPATGLESGEYTAVIVQSMLKRLISIFIELSHHAKLVLDGSSRYKKEYVVMQVYHPKITLYSDGALDNGVESAPFDSEGTPTGRRYLIRDGKIGFWGPKEYASRLGLELLGEADGLRNICIEPEQGSPTYDGMLKQEGYVFLITGLNAIHTKASQSKGEMNVSVKGTVYKDGKVVGGINNAMIEVDDFYKLIAPDSQFRLSSDTIQGLPVFETKLKFKMGGNGN